jgi:hypothetical protein
MNAAGSAPSAPHHARADRPIEREVRQSLSLLALTAVSMALYLGVGLLAVRVLG